MAAQKIKTQAALDKALKKSPSGEFELNGPAFFLRLAEAAGPIFLIASGSLEIVTASGSSTVTAYGSSTVRAYGSSTVRAYDSSTVTAYDSSTVTAYDSSTVRAYDSSTVRAYDSSTVRAYGSSTVTASGSSTVRASGFVFVQTWTARVRITAAASVIVAQRGPACTVSGADPVVQPNPATAEAWCSHHGVHVVDGVATLFKAVGAGFKSHHGGDYRPGNSPSVPVFRPEPECAAGALYFSPTTAHTRVFVSEPAHFVACPVALKDIVLHPNGDFPDKVKAKGVCGPVYEVDADGNTLAVAA